MHSLLYLAQDYFAAVDSEYHTILQRSRRCSGATGTLKKRVTGSADKGTMTDFSIPNLINHLQ